ncbi:MAG TPA: TIGR00730 family Rossman fold protein [Geminicoccaceae bacterium]|nr:TIGR00730 family Rossman fold protein [Geminicoccaceae bacterium]
MAISICVFCGSRYGADPRFRAAATRLGDLMGRTQSRLIYGGGHVGLMGAVADAAIAAGGEVVGLIPARLLEREVGHRAITELIVTKDMFERKQQMIDRADAFVILPGGLGSLDELLEVVTLRQLGYHGKPIVVVNLGGYWDPLIGLVDRVVEQKFAEPSARTLYRMVDGVEEVLPALGVSQPPAAALRVAGAE